MLGIKWRPIDLIGHTLLTLLQESASTVSLKFDVLEQGLLERKSTGCHPLFYSWRKGLWSATSSEFIIKLYSTIYIFFNLARNLKELATFAKVSISIP
jgi:hypothetical protein